MIFPQSHIMSRCSSVCSRREESREQRRMRDTFKSTMVEDLCIFSASYGNAISTKDVRWLCLLVRMADVS